jgi:hypothetical protein
VYTYSIGSIGEWIIPLIILAIVGTIVELISPKDVDNVIIPAVIIIMGMILVILGLWPGINTIYQPFWGL